MKRLSALVCLLLLFCCGCTAGDAPARIAATTLPVYEFTARLCEGTDITVTRLVTESVSCLHDYSLNVRQVRAAEAAELIAVSGAGLEEFMSDILDGRECTDASIGISLLCPEEEPGHEDIHSHQGHHHEEDPHIWLSPANAAVMAENLCAGLCRRYPEHTDLFRLNLQGLLKDIGELRAYGEETLSGLSCRKMVTFHDGFAYFADAFGLTILEAVEEESGSEASARELKYLIGLVRNHDLPAIFIEANGSVSAAEVIARETGVAVYTLDMAMSGESWFDAMYRNINTIKEALG